MVLHKEYRICMPLSVEEYRIGQLYTIAKHSQERSQDGEGVEVLRNEECHDDVHGAGHLTEKVFHIGRSLPSWVRSMIPKIFSITETARNFYPYTVTEYHCNFLPKFTMRIETRFLDDAGQTDNALGLDEERLSSRQVVMLDIAKDECQPKHYKEEEDPTKFQSEKTGRGPLGENWKEEAQPIMCSYKFISVGFEVWGFQTRVEEYVHSHVLREILLVAHKQAFTWIDEWFGWTFQDVKDYEHEMQSKTNAKVKSESKESN